MISRASGKPTWNGQKSWLWRHRGHAGALKKAQIDKCWVWKPSPSSSLNDDIVLNDGIDMVENSRLVLGEVMGRPANIRCTFRSAQVTQFASSSSEHAALLPLHFALAAPRTKVSIDYSPRNSKTSQ